MTTENTTTPTSINEAGQHHGGTARPGPSTAIKAKAVTIKRAAVSLAVLAMVATGLAFIGGFTQASAQTREPATRPSADVVVAAEDAVVDEVDHRTPASRPDGADGSADAAADSGDDAQSNPVQSTPVQSISGENATTDEAAAAEISYPGDGNDEFHRCVEEQWSQMQEPLADDEWNAAVAAIEAQIAEICVPLLPADEQADFLAQQAYRACQDEIYSALDASGGEFAEEQYEALHEQALAECLPLLPEAEQAGILAWEAYYDCIDARTSPDTPYAETLAARRACLDVLPEELRTDQEAYLDYEICLADNGAYDGGWNAGDTGTVNIYATDLFEELILGDEPATITITSDGSSVTIETDGDVTVFDYEAQYEAQELAYATCSDLEPYAAEHLMHAEDSAPSLAIPIPISAPARSAGS